VSVGAEAPALFFLHEVNTNKYKTGMNSNELTRFILLISGLKNIGFILKVQSCINLLWQNNLNFLKK
jgi:hypothetical protein